MSSRSADIVVVGAGIIGASAALELSKLGRNVVVVDKAGGPGYGSTSASSAVVRFNYSTWDGVATAWESKQCWDAWEDHLQFRDSAGLASFHRTGKVMLDVPIAPVAKAVELFDQVGVPYEVWDAATLRARIPGIDSGRYWPPKPVDADAFFADAEHQLGGLYTPDAGFVDDPQLATHNLAAAAQHRGVEFVFNRRVVAVDRSGGRVHGVRLSDGSTISTPVVLNAAGPWSHRLNDLADVGEDFTVNVRPMRQEVHQVPAPPGYHTGPLVPLIADLDLGTYIRPDHRGDFLLVGGTEPECDPFEWIDDPDQADPRATNDRFRAQVTRAARRLPELTVPNSATGVAGVYDVTDDWTPIYDRTSVDGFYVAIGTSGNQFKNAPLVGQFMASLISAVEAGHDHDGDALAFHCPRTGNTVNLGAFSRKRPVNSGSSGTVMG